ncbi:MAG: hypothetical protein KDC18_07580 [Alphaproteobacteria bacterium]|nr:hypothetical protein [Alphaproteobacteria bacterium]MCB9927989.1 hypothetical protein [Alphaproteobacteria bacterium]
MQAVASTDTRPIPVVEKVGAGSRTDYIGSPGIIDANPQAFLVDRLYPGAHIAPHFHDVDQYQVVVGGFCTMGKKAAPPVTFQYADAYTPYGPIKGEEKGFVFFTLRPVASGGFFPMPGSREHMPGRAGRNIAGHFDRSGPRPAVGECVAAALMDGQNDGVDARGYRLGAGASMTGPVSDGGGQYYLVCEGEVAQHGKTLPQWSLLYVAAGEPAPVLTAGAEGADVLMLQFCRPGDRPGSNPAELAKRDPNAYRHRPGAPASESVRR